jgi:hypothetical protein
MMNSAVENDDNIFSSTVTSFQQSRAAKRSAMLISTDDNSNALKNHNNKYERLNKSKRK